MTNNPATNLADNPVFIVGCDRSGTTLLRLMLIQSPELYIPAESKFMPILREREGRYGDFSLPSQRCEFIRDLQSNKATAETFTFPIFGLTAAQAEQILADASPTDFAGASAALFRACAQNKHKSRWGDKTPYHVLDLPWLSQAFPSAKFIHIIRDGRDVAISLIKLGWVYTIQEAAFFWKERVEKGRADGKKLGGSRYREISYEDLIGNTEESLRSLCGWLDLKYVPQMMEYHKTSKKHIPQEHSRLFKLADKPVDQSRVYAWKRTLNEEQIAQFESIAGPILKELNYEITGIRPPAWKKVLRLPLIFSGVQPPFWKRGGRLAKRMLDATLPPSISEKVINSLKKFR